jgi:Leucine-rich repeat (LRR) protein
MCVLLTLSFCGAVVGAAEKAPAADSALKLLRFPADRAVGVVHRRPAVQGTYALTAHVGWKLIGEARGEITIPATDDVRLDVATSASKDLSFLDALLPDSIQVLQLEDTVVDDEGLKHVGRLTGLRVLDLDHTRITDAGAAHLAGLTRLQQVNLCAFRVEREGFGIGDAGLAVFAKLPELEFLGLRRTRITDAGMKALRGHRSLKWLGVEGTRVTDAGLITLRTLPALEFLSLGVYREGALITDRGLRYVVGELTNLKRLRLSGTKITNNGLVHLRKLTGLEELSLDETKVTHEGLKHLAPLTSLQKLRFYVNGKLGDEAAIHLSALKSLRELTANLESTDRGLEAVATLPHLESLTVDGDHGVTAAGLAHLWQMKSLKDLDLRSCPLTDDHLAKMKALSNLERLSLSSTLVTGNGLWHLKDLPKLTALSINFGDHRHSDYFSARPHLGHLRDLKQLTDLRIQGDGLINDDLQHLSGLVRLNRLTIHEMLIDDKAAIHIAGLTSLQELDLENAVLSDIGLRYLGNLQNLEYLNLRGHFTDRGLEHLRSLKSLGRAYLSSPYLTDEGVAALAAALPSLGTVKRNPYHPAFED